MPPSPSERDNPQLLLLLLLLLLMLVVVAMMAMFLLPLLPRCRRSRGAVTCCSCVAGASRPLLPCCSCRIACCSCRTLCCGCCSCTAPAQALLLSGWSSGSPPSPERDSPPPERDTLPTHSSGRARLSEAEALLQSGMLRVLQLCCSCVAGSSGGGGGSCESRDQSGRHTAGVLRERGADSVCVCHGGKQAASARGGVRAAEESGETDANEAAGVVLCGGSGEEAAAVLLQLLRLQLRFGFFGWRSTMKGRRCRLQYTCNCPREP